LGDWGGLRRHDDTDAGLTEIGAMRRVLNQAANTARNLRGRSFIVYRPVVPRLGHAQAIGIAHRLCRLIWKILHQGIRYEERGPAVSAEAKKVRVRKMIRELRSLGDYRVELLPCRVQKFGLHK
jgi:hypothetical protein